jgi:ribonuclease P protein component
MFGRLVRSADFERVLRIAPKAKSPHFALHHVGGRPSRPARAAAGRPDLSTEAVPLTPRPVDESSLTAPGPDLWLGTVIPKRHARRSVTRSLLKRQIRAAIGRQPGMPPGLWVVRLRAPIERARFISAASDALADVMRRELDAVLASVARSAPIA